jgi:hypothetical protein
MSDIPASRWLTRLTYGFKKAGHNPSTPELFLDAIEMLLEGEAAKRLDSTPRLRRIVDQHSTAKARDVDDIKEWLQEEFPTAVTDVAEVDMQRETVLAFDRVSMLDSIADVASIKVLLMPGLGGWIIYILLGNLES